MVSAMNRVLWLDDVSDGFRTSLLVTWWNMDVCFHGTR